MELKQLIPQLRAKSVRASQLDKEAKELKSEVKSYWGSIIDSFEDMGVDAVQIDGKKLSVTESDRYDYPIEHKQEIIQWCIDNDRLEFIDCTKATFHGACKAEVESAEEEEREAVLPPHADIVKLNKVNGLR